MATGTQYTRFACHDIEFNSFRGIVALQKAIIRQNNMKTIEAETLPMALFILPMALWP
jgi:hypothetical protein